MESLAGELSTILSLGGAGGGSILIAGYVFWNKISDRFEKIETGLAKDICTIKSDIAYIKGKLEDK